jgi:hypothetical protein
MSGGRAVEGGEPRGSVLFVGNSYYNNYYLARALRRLGWRADVLTYSAENAAQFVHGWDLCLDYGEGWDARVLSPVAGLLEATLMGLSRVRAPRSPAARRAWRRVLGALLQAEFSAAGWGERRRLRSLAASPLRYDVFHFTGIRNLRWLYFANPARFGSQPIGWDIRLLRQLGTKIVYSHTGCLDGVSQSSFRKWGPEPVCDICRWRDVPEVCSDDLNLAWGRLRNELCDFQCLLGGNRVDCNVDPRIHEVPEFYCLDEEIWKPDLELPEAHRLPLARDAVKIYHSVGNLELRSLGVDKRNIKSTHVIIPMVERLKAEGYPVELVFCHDRPNTEVRFYQAQADVVVDMLSYGFFGANAREAMMLGKPVVCYLRPEWLKQAAEEIPEYVRDLPVVSATPETVLDVVRDLVRDPDKRRLIGKRSREFALRWHSAAAAGRRFDAIYSRLVEGESGETGRRVGAIAQQEAGHP